MKDIFNNTSFMVYKSYYEISVIYAYIGINYVGIQRYLYQKY